MTDKVSRRSRFNDSQLDALLPGFHTDGATMGLQLMVRKTRRGSSRTWLYRFTWRGEWARMTIGHRPGMSLAEARDKVVRLRRLMDDGIDPRRSENRRQPKQTPKTLSAAAVGTEYSVERLAHEFMEQYVRPNRKAPEYVQRILNKDVLSKDGWQGRDARTITSRQVIDLLDGIRARGSAVMCNRTAALLKQMFMFGIHRAILTTTPVQLLVPPGGTEKPRQRALSDTELQAFLADPTAATRFARLGRVITLLLLTGQRRGELAAARWSHIDLKAKTWKIPAENSKNGREQLVPLSAWAVEEFEHLKKRAGRSVWVLPAKDPAQHLDPKLLSRGVAKNLERFKKIGIKPFTLHDLRRTCRTGLSRLKVASHVAEMCIGHSQAKLLATYDVHEYIDEKRAALNLWADHLRTLMTPPQAARAA